MDYPINIKEILYGETYPFNIKKILKCECLPVYCFYKHKSYKKKSSVPDGGITMDNDIITMDNDIITLDNT